MSYSYQDVTWSSDPLGMPLGTCESLTFEDFETYFETQPRQTANPYPSPKRPQQQQPIASTFSSIPTWDFNGSSSSIYPVSRGSSFPELPWTADTSYSELHPIPNGGNVISDTFNNFDSSVDYNNTFLANIDPSLSINSNLFTATPNPSMARAPNPVGHLSPSSRKRPYVNEEPDFNHASYNPSPKRRRLSTDSRIDLSTVVLPPHFYNNSNPIPDIVNNGYVPTSPVPKSQTNVIPPQPHSYLNHHVSHPFVNISPAPATISPAYVPMTQPGSSVPSQAIDYSTGSNTYLNANLYTASGGRNAFPSDPLSYLTLPQGENGTSDWMIDLLGSENFISTAAFGTTPSPSVPTLVPLSLAQQASGGAPYNNVIHTNAYANIATRSGVDNCQHLNTKPHMSKTGHTANASMPRTGMPSTRGASSAELVSTLESNQLTPPLPPSPTPAPPRLTKARGKRRKQQPSPATHLWTLVGKKYKCLYNGPAMPGGCDKFPSTLKNLGRHMRTHACAEDKMSIPEADKVALNGLPEELQVEVARCFLGDADLHHCAYFREHGKRWSEVTLERPDNASRKHDVYNHPREYRKCSEKRQEKSPKEKKAKSPKKPKAKS